MLKKIYTDFNEWKIAAEELGWVHVHDNIVVCDGEDDELIGEFLEDGSGWIINDTP